MKNVLEWLETAAYEHPNRIVYEDMTETISFGDLYNEARRIGSALIREHLSEKPIAVMMGRSVHTIAAFLGIVYSGRAYAPIDTTQPAARIKKILSLLDPDAAISDGSFDLHDIVSGIRVFDQKALRDHEILKEELEKVRQSSLDSDPLYIIFTSGSSGRPKGVLTSHHSLINYISAYTGMMEIKGEDRLCSQSPLDYIAAIRDIYVPLFTGAYSFLCPKEYFMQPGPLCSLMNEKKITCIGWSTSALTVLSKLNAFKEEKPKHLKKICFSGSVMPPKVIMEWQAALPEALFVNQYGPTEATASCTYYKLDHMISEDEVLPVGTPYDNYKVVLLSPDETPVKEGELGEICIGGPSLALGYYNDNERTESSFVRNPLNKAWPELIYKTGDLGSYRKDGLLEFHGRMDRQIKHIGHRVELDEIEHAALSIPGITETAALYDAEKENIWLFYSGETAVKGLLTELRKSLPGFMVPRKVKQLEALPKLPNGKTDMETLKGFF